jgi:fibro-slime domain-containing protein
MLRLGFRPPVRLVLGLATLCVGAIGCTAGVKPTQPAGSAGATGSAGTTGLGGGGGTISITGTGGSSSPGTGGTLPVPPGCGDGINNQGGIEDCDDGNTVAGDGCNGICHVEPNWNCPSAGACTRKNACGDGVIGAGEVCDDKNMVDGDGCNATCTVQDPAFTCIPGSACIRSSICGNKRVEPGENCDDGNTAASDGCSASCQVEQGWVCTAPGTPCARAARCGDGVVNIPLGEVCDDGNITEGDGCSGDCKAKGAGCSCVPGMKCVCPEVRCGNGTIEGNEKCDDGNANSGDGCTSTCTIERGYVCPLIKAPCVPDCGDGILTGNEPCDPGIAVQRMACSAQCRWNPGWACTGNPVTECHATTCGDNKKEGSEGCDDGNTKPYDGCSATCQAEPNCTSSNGICTGKCGDGILLSGEVCDDGNNLAGDGCSADCKTVDAGFTCKQPPLGDYIDVPVVYRDFLTQHADFENESAVGQNNAVTGLVGTMLDAMGKPTFVGTANQGFITSAASFRDWYNDVSGVNHTTASTLRLCRNAAGNYVNRWGANCEAWPVTVRANFCGNPNDAMLDAMGDPIPCTFKFGTTECDMVMAMNPGATRISCTVMNNSYVAVFQTGTIDGTPVFFPVDGDNFTPAAERDYARIGPPYADNSYPSEMPAKLHNFSFTSEVRYWFPFDSSKSYTLKFLGDDDVWVFINRRLAVDLGGIHTAVGCNSLVATCAIGQVVVNAANNFGMTNGNVYEVVVFQAERKKTSSTYQLTLSAFNGAPTACGPTCGDRVVTPPEQCDNGTANNTGGYNKCTADCKLGPYCGDMMVTDGEGCDNGRNDDAYGATTGCGPGCKLPARCGDLIIQTEYGEQCDDGTNSGAYGGCTAQCQRAGYCGDGKVQSPQEQCDDGANDGTYGNCGDPMMPLPNCQFGPRCGDGVVQDQYGEQCEPTGANDPNCTKACRKPGICGDGVQTPPEECDYGAVENNGEYGGCAPGCVRAARCGDGVKNGPEDCDDGVNDNSYGGCSPQCKLAPHCGDGMTNPPYEQCDDGVNNGPTGQCSTVCKFNVQ